MAVAAIAAELRRAERQHRPQPLAAGLDQMVGELGDQLDVGAGARQDDGVDAAHVRGDKPGERARALASDPRFLERYDDAHVTILWLPAAGAGSMMAQRGTGTLVPQRRSFAATPGRRSEQNVALDRGEDAA